MDRLSFANPVFGAYALAAARMVLKTIAMAWLTVLKKSQVKAGCCSPEDARRTALNPDPRPGQVGPDPRHPRHLLGLGRADGDLHGARRDLAGIGVRTC